ncbi:MAG: protein kinase [Planctomycetes bacterium]|nr:protein kinase [Planctomycetota bacterium]HPY74438.1 protein kinase [Planctomycetota bacterium]HQA99989.1 protein kinase [Planctomycetota bacterium]
MDSFVPTEDAKLGIINLPKGTQIGGYTIIQEISRGGMGIVYLAEDPQLKRHVALKMIIMQATEGQERSLKRFFRESAICGKMNHPNIMKVYNAGTYKGNPYLVMEYIEGEPLLEYVKKQPENDWNCFANIMLEIVRALQYAHSKKIVHRDLKPDNILIRPNGQPVVLDFGLARIENDISWQLTRTGEIMGSIYMAPEQAAGEAKYADNRADIYSMGAIFYVMLTKQPPFSSDQTMKLLRQIQHIYPPNPCTINESIPRVLEEIVLHSMEKKPEHRFQTANEMEKLLQNFFKGKTKVSLRYQQTLWLRQHKQCIQKTGMITAFLSILAILFSFYFFSTKKSSKISFDDNVHFILSLEKNYEKGLQEWNETMIPAWKSRFQHWLGNFWSELGTVYDQQGDDSKNIDKQEKMYNKAIMYFSNIGKIFPRKVDNYQKWNNTYRKLYQLYPKKYIDNYHDILSKYIELQKWDYNLYIERFHVCIQKEKYEDAKQDILKAIQLDPAKPDAYILYLEYLLDRGTLDIYQELIACIKWFYRRRTSVSIPDLLHHKDFCYQFIKKEYDQYFVMDENQYEWDEKKCEQFLISYSTQFSSIPQEIWKRMFIPFAKYENFFPVFDKYRKTAFLEKDKEKYDLLFQWYIDAQIPQYLLDLASYFTGADNDVLLKINRNLEVTLTCLERILKDERQELKFRFFSACALVALRNPQADNILRTIANEKKGIPSVLATLAYSQSYPLIPLQWTSADWLSLQNYVHNPYIKVIWIQYLPEKQIQCIAPLLDDTHPIIQLWAARRVLLSEYDTFSITCIEKARNIVVDNLQNIHQLDFCRFCIDICYRLWEQNYDLIIHMIRKKFSPTDRDYAKYIQNYNILEESLPKIACFLTSPDENLQCHAVHLLMYLTSYRWRKYSMETLDVANNYEEHRHKPKYKFLNTFIQSPYKDKIISLISYLTEPQKHASTNKVANILHSFLNIAGNLYTQIDKEVSQSMNDSVAKIKTKMMLLTVLSEHNQYDIVIPILSSEKTSMLEQISIFSSLRLDKKHIFDRSFNLIAKLEQIESPIIKTLLCHCMMLLPPPSDQLFFRKYLTYKDYHMQVGCLSGIAKKSYKSFLEIVKKKMLTERDMLQEWATYAYVTILGKNYFHRLPNIKTYVSESEKKGALYAYIYMIHSNIEKLERKMDYTNDKKTGDEENFINFIDGDLDWDLMYYYSNFIKKMILHFQTKPYKKTSNASFLEEQSLEGYLTCYKAALQLHSELPNFFAHNLNILLEQGLLYFVLSDKLQKENPTLSKKFLNQGFENIRKCYVQEPNDALVHKYLCYAYMKTNQFKEAEQELQKCLHKNPWELEFWQWYSRIVDKDKKEEVETYYQYLCQKEKLYQKEELTKYSIRDLIQTKDLYIQWLFDNF